MQGESGETQDGHDLPNLHGPESCIAKNRKLQGYGCGHTLFQFHPSLQCPASRKQTWCNWQILPAGLFYRSGIRTRWRLSPSVTVNGMVCNVDTAGYRLAKFQTEWGIAWNLMTDNTQDVLLCHREGFGVVILTPLTERAMFCTI